MEMITAKAARWLGIFLVAGCSGAPTPLQAQSPREVFEAYWAAADRGDLDAMASFFATGAVYEDIPFEFSIAGRSAIREMLEQALAGLHPVERRVLRVVADSSFVAVEWEVEGVHAGPILGVPPGGRVLRFRTLSLLEIRDGRIMRVTDYTDRTSLEKQLAEIR